MPLRDEVIRSYYLVHPSHPEMSMEVTFYSDEMALAWLPILLQFDNLLSQIRKAQAQAQDQQTDGPSTNSKGH